MSTEKPIVQTDDWMARRRRRADLRSLERLIALSAILEQEQTTDANADDRESVVSPDVAESSRYRFELQRPSLQTGC